MSDKKKLPDGCEACIFFKPEVPFSRDNDSQKNMGCCHRNAPATSLVLMPKFHGPTFHDAGPVWPVVRTTDWCGEFKEGQFPKARPEMKTFHLFKDKKNKYKLEEGQAWNLERETVIFEERFHSKVEAQAYALEKVPGLNLTLGEVVMSVEAYYGYYPPGKK